MQSILNRREFLGAPILGAAAASAVASAHAQGQWKRPNLVYVLADHLGLNRCGYSGDQHAVTPNIDRWAAQSFDLQQTASPPPDVVPHRDSRMTGRYQSSTGMVTNELRLILDHNDSVAESTWCREQWTQDRNIITTATGTKHDLERLREIQARYAVED